MRHGHRHATEDGQEDVRGHRGVVHRQASPRRLSEQATIVERLIRRASCQCGNEEGISQVHYGHSIGIWTSVSSSSGGVSLGSLM